MTQRRRGGGVGRRTTARRRCNVPLPLSLQGDRDSFVNTGLHYSQLFVSQAFVFFANRERLLEMRETIVAVIFIVIQTKRD